MAGKRYGLIAAGGKATAKRFRTSSDVSLMLSICDIACHHGSSLPLWISEMSITDYIRKGKLGAIRLGRSYRITSSDLELFIESNRLCKPASSVEPSQS
jgi:excisionase family DNA binding protein